MGNNEINQFIQDLITEDYSTLSPLSQAVLQLCDINADFRDSLLKTLEKHTNKGEAA